MARATTAVCTMLAAIGLWGCGDELVGDEELRCDRAYTGSELEGRWELRGSGERIECEDRRLEGALTIETSTRVRVMTEAQETTGPGSGPETDFEADAFVDRIERADFLVEQTDGAPDTLTVQGSVSGSCFRVHLEEELPDGDTISYDLDGFITRSGTAEGEFTGRGPESCTTAGTFTLRVE